MCSSGLLCCMYVCPTIHKYMCVCVCVWVGACLCVCVYIYMCVCMYIYIHMYMCIYIYIHMSMLPVFANVIIMFCKYQLPSPRYINSGIKKPELKAVSARASIEFQLQLI